MFQLFIYWPIFLQFLTFSLIKYWKYITLTTKYNTWEWSGVSNEVVWSITNYSTLPWKMHSLDQLHPPSTSWGKSSTNGVICVTSAQLHGQKWNSLVSILIQIIATLEWSYFFSIPPSRYVCLINHLDIDVLGSSKLVSFAFSHLTWWSRDCSPFS
jgi:hypothetical protein